MGPADGPPRGNARDVEDNRGVMIEAPRLFTLQKVAERLRKSRRWMQDDCANPFGRKTGRTWLFTEVDIFAITGPEVDRPRRPWHVRGTSAEVGESAKTARRGEAQAIKAKRDSVVCGRRRP